MSKDTLISDQDPWLAEYKDQIQIRASKFAKTLREINDKFGSLQNFANGYKYYGFNLGENDSGQKGVWYREWAPGAISLALTGDFNNWSRFDHPMKKDRYGVWSIFLKSDLLSPNSRLKVHITTRNTALDRIPAYIRQVGPDPLSPHGLVGIYSRVKSYKFSAPKPTLKSAPKIYEAHIGIAQEKYGVGSFDEFRQKVLPRIKALGYNCVQLMAIAEHPYYASFGYQVSNFFAVSHRFGPPEDLKRLIDTCHQLGIAVFLDLVHSHTVKNINEGLNQLDGTSHQYFHEGDKGHHSSWDTLLFDYGKTEVLRFLLSNVAYWLEEFNFDGFRFDGVTSMLYQHHGIGINFDHLSQYFDSRLVDQDAITYLQLANQLTHELYPQAITIAEDVSGMPGLCQPASMGGVGFDYRLNMAVPDFWIRELKHQPDENWSIPELVHQLTNRRQTEKHIGYAESHDQALVGDKTLAFWLMDQDMYWHMRVDDSNPVIERGIALHKLIRLVTYGLSGEGYLNFMGNEFGHPEWIDFPRDGNNNSFHYARRQWSLVDNPQLKYQFLNNFDAKMIKLDNFYNFLSNPHSILAVDQDQKILVFRRGALIFAFNFHPHQSYPNLEFHAPNVCKIRIVLDSDKKEFGGFNRLKPPYTLKSKLENFSVYSMSRTALVFEILE